MKIARIVAVAVVFLLSAVLAEKAGHPDWAFLIGFLCWPTCGFIFRKLSKPQNQGASE